MINWYVLTGIILRCVSVGLLSVYVLPIQLRELKRPARDNLVVAMRWVLFTMVVLYETQQLLPLSYQFIRLHTEPYFNLQNVATVGSNIGMLALAVCLMVLYKLAHMLSKRNDV